MNIEALASDLTAGSVGGLAAFGVAFLGGLVAGFGPCVLPMLPAVFGYVTGTVVRDPAEERPAVLLARGLGLSAVFVVGMSLVFAAIGALAGFLGRALMFGAWTYYVIAAICVVIALQMLDVIALPIDRFNTLLPVKRPERRGIVGALIFGMLFGLVASPCSTPILAAIAAIAATTGSAAKGGALLFVYGLGKGVPLLLLGVASGSLGFMRKISSLTPWLTKLGGVGLLGAAGYLVWLAWRSKGDTMSEIVIQIIPEAGCGWGSGGDCCDPLESSPGEIVEGATWEMPLQWRLQVLEAQLRKRLGLEITLVEADLFGLIGGERMAALDALVRGDVLPFAILGDEVISAGGLEEETLTRAVQRVLDSP